MVFYLLNKHASLALSGLRSLLTQVAGACLYIVCRQELRPYMLIDFSDVLQTNVYVLGAVFLQLCRLLRLEQHPLMQKPIDPSLFIHRFADKLNLGRCNPRSVPACYFVCARSNTLLSIPIFDRSTDLKPRVLQTHARSCKYSSQTGCLHEA